MSRLIELSFLSFRIPSYMKKRCRLFLHVLLLLTLLSSFETVCATEKYKFRTLSPEGGFYYDGVKQIEQDREGFMWIVMDNDLYRFDGYQYKAYHSYFSDIDETKDWLFLSIIADSKGNLYVNTGNGIYRYNSMSDSFSRIFERVDNLRIDNRDNIWIRNKNKWSILDVEKHSLITPLYEGDSIRNAGPVFCTYNDDLYLFTDCQRIYRYNYSKNEFVHCFTMPNKDGRIVGAKAYEGKLWVFVNNYGLYQINLSTFTIDTHFDFFAQHNTTYRSFFVDKNGHVWFGTIDGLYILNPSTGKYTHYTHSDSDPFSLPNNSIWTINQDFRKNVWIGTYSGAICYVNIDEKDAFDTYQPRISGLSHVPVSSFAEDNNYLWVGTEGGGVNRMDKKTGRYTYLTHKEGLTYNNIKSTLIDNDRYLWSSMFIGGLDLIDLHAEKYAVKNFKHIPEDANSLLTNNIRKIILENNSGIWITYQYQKTQLSFYSFREKSFTHFDLENDENKSKSYIFDILRQGDNALWAISNEKLYKLDIKTGMAESIEGKDSVFMHLNTFCLDDSGNIWIGTIGNGLIKYNTNTSEYTFLKDILQYKVYSIYSMCYDNGKIWMGTDNGLFCYDTEAGEYMKFDESDGTQGQVYYPLACMKSKDGRLFFGGTKGFTIVDPKKISLNSYMPRVIISDFFIDHIPSKPHYVSEDSKYEIVLNYDQANFGFKFSSDNYLIPEKNLFKYRLRGYDERWIEVDASNRIAMYSKVPAGTYYFEVLAANNDGVWSDTPTVIRVERKAAPWQSWPAYFIYMLLTVGIIYMLFRYYNDKKELKMQLYLEGVEKDKKEQIHNAQLRFFTNISHDFRTPLSLIIAALERLRQEGIKEYYYRILNGNSQRLLSLVNELMDFRTVENGKLKLELQPQDINKIVKDVATDFSDYAEQREIVFDVKCDSDLSTDIYLDKNVIEKIVMNLLNNAFKYTGDKGIVTIETRAENKPFVSRYENSHFVEGNPEISDKFFIIVSDTGVGISKESINSVFERFYKVNTVNADSHLGTGIGLALVKSLVLLHKGNITIYSDRDLGTDLIIEFPIDKEIFDESDFVQKKKADIEQKLKAEIKDSLPTIEELEEKVLLSDKKKILLAEDNDDLRELISGSLSSEYEIVEAVDGLEASKLIEELDVDLIISDIMMPHKDGIALCSEVKGDMSTSHIPFVLLTAKTSLESKIEGVDSGADMYFEKPVDLNYLKISIQNIFKHQLQLKEYYAKNYFADNNSELSANEHDNKFLKKFIAFIEEHIDESEMDVNLIASEFSMSRSKLYTKMKNLTGKSIVEFVLSYRLRKAAKLIIEENMTMKEVMLQIGIESQPYFTNSFKKEFGETPTSFAAKYRKKK